MQRWKQLPACSTSSRGIPAGVRITAASSVVQNMMVNTVLQHQHQFSQLTRASLPDAQQSVGPPNPAVNINLIASDVDGTLLNSQQKLTAGVEAAVLQAADAGVPMLLATGKAQGPWVAEVFPRLKLSLPTVFMQGLLITDVDGTVLYSRGLPDEVVLQCIQLAAQYNMTLTAYCNDRIFCAETNEQSDRLLWYKEPTPEAVGDLESYLLGRIEVHKLIFMDSQETINALRPTIETALLGKASMTTAIKGMLEVLPLGASKGGGVSWLLHHKGLSAAGLLALGDGENDIEMLQLAAIGAAMGNAGPNVKAVADVVLSSNDNDGVAEAISKFVLQPRGLEMMNYVGASSPAASAAEVSAD